MALPADLDVTPGDPNLPLVLLLHGNSGTKNDMVNPAALGFNYDWFAPMQPDRDLGWSWYPHVGPYSFNLDSFKGVTSWRAALQARGFRTAAYSQVDPDGPIAGPAQQLAEVVNHLRTTQPNPKIVLLAHSRGGLVSRKFLKDFAWDTTLMSAIGGLITLHSPHNGSSLANVAVSINNAINGILSVQPAMAPVLDWLRDMVNAPSYLEMSQGGAFLSTLQAGERPQPGVAHATFGGTSVLFSRLLSWWYNWEGAIAQWHWPPYHLVIYQSEVGGVSPVANGPLCSVAFGAVPELAHGVGDLLTTDAGARLPFAAHRTNHLNHAEALWNPNLHQQVLGVLAVIRLDGTLLREASNAPVYVIFGGAKFWIPNPTVLQHYGGWSAVQIVPDGTLAAVPTIPKDGTVLREMSSAPVYVMRRGRRCWIPDPTILQRFGGWAAVRIVPDGTLSSIPEGAKIAITAIYGSTVKMGHLLTTRALHSHLLNYGHPGTSGQQQVTAFEGYDDNDLWRVKGPHGQPVTYRAGQPVQHGDIIRFEHVPTGRNLHSHAGVPSPLTSQQEVTCFGQSGTGDGNDNWRLEIAGGGIWEDGKRVRLIHLNTNHALHSHGGFSHPSWTAGQQEVTGFAGRDDNDWWSLFEIR
jgi:hypothetical protein